MHSESPQLIAASWMQAPPQNETEILQWMHLYQHVIEHLPIGCYVLHLEQPDDPASLRLLVTNPVVNTIAGFDVVAEVGRYLIEIYPNAVESGLAQIYAQVARDGGVRDLGEVAYGDERVEAGFFAVQAFQLLPMYACVLLENVTARRKAEETMRQAVIQESIIRAHEQTLAELSTPLLTISLDVVVMPLIGSIDTRRAQQILEELLDGISRTRARIAIVDVTGVPIVDTQVASALLRTAQAVQLLGARVMLTGIRPEMAQTLVGLGVNLASITTYGTLQSAIQVALGPVRN